MEKWLVREENYAETMDTVVLPYLESRKRELRIKTKDGNAQAVYQFRAENPRKVVVISHGFTETVRKHAEAIFYFLLHDYEVYVPEHCGHGHSYRLTEDPCRVHVDSYQRYITDLLRVVSLARKEYPDLPLTLYGHSMGGGIAAAAAGRKPSWFDRVILSSPMIQPQTGNIPWLATRALSSLMCLIGKADTWVFGAGPYQGLEDFASSASTSKARFDYYQNYRFHEKTAQMSGASFGWIHAAVQLHEELMTETWKNLRMPLLMLQAESDQYVRNDEQDRFMELVKEQRGSQAEMVQIPGAKHEIFNSKDETMESYWKQIFTLR